MDRYQSTLEKLRHMLEGWSVENGGRLPAERELANQLGVGRRVLRRALSVLEADGLISRQQGRGTFITKRPESSVNGSYEPAGDVAAPATIIAHPSVNWLTQRGTPMELVELRLNIEPIMARLAALRSSQMDVEDLQMLARRTREARNHEDYQIADLAFHRKIAELSRNSLFLILFDSLCGALRDEAMRRFGENGHCFKRQANHVRFHESIAEAVAKRDPELAERLMQDHLADVHQSLFVTAMPAGYRQWREAQAG